MKFALDDAEMDAQLQRTATAAYSASADLGEALTTARRVSPGDYDAWFAEWATLAERVDNQAHVSAGGGHDVSAAKAYLRATESWRQAIFFTRGDLDDPRLLNGWRAHRTSFRNALRLLPWGTTIDELPFGGGRMTTYLLRPRADATLRPTVLAPCGFDSTAEAGYALSEPKTFRLVDRQEAVPPVHGNRRSRRPLLRAWCNLVGAGYVRLARRGVGPRKCLCIATKRSSA